MEGKKLGFMMGGRGGGEIRIYDGVEEIRIYDRWVEIRIYDWREEEIRIYDGGKKLGFVKL